MKLVLAALLLSSGAQAKVLYEHKGELQLCDGSTEFKRSFKVKAAGPVEVEIKGLKGVTREHKGEPRVWLDDTLLGPLRQEHGPRWLSPRSLTLSAGAHELSIECGAEPFSLENLVIRDLLRSSATPSRPSVGAGLAPPAGPAPCESLALNRGWPGDPKRAIVLSVLSGREARSGLLARLKRGETLQWWFKLNPHAGAGGIEYPPIELSESRSDKGDWVLGFQIDNAELKEALAKKLKGLRYEPKGYKPGRWNELKLSFCADGRFLLEVGGGEVRGELKVDDLEMPLEIRASDLELQIKGEKEP